MVGSAAIRRGDVIVADLPPARGQEIQKTRPCVVVSPDEQNDAGSTLIIAPLTTGTHPYPSRVPCRVAGKNGHVVLDQLRTIDRARVQKRIGRIAPATLGLVLAVLREMFAE